MKLHSIKNNLVISRWLCYRVLSTWSPSIITSSRWVVQVR